MKKELQDWLNSHPIWFQEAACRVLNQNTLEEKDYAELMDLLKNPPAHLPKGRPYPELRSGAGDDAGLRIESIGPVEGIDALNPKNPLSFEGANLAVVYGENGAGKSGYARILKKASGRGEKLELQSNVFEDPPMRRTCSFQLSRGGGSLEGVEWQPEGPALEALGALEVFDRQTGRILLDKGSELTFLPPELDLLDRLGQVSRHMTDLVEAEEAQLVERLPQLPGEFAGTPIGEKYTKLRSNTRVDELATWAESDEAELKRVEALLSSADPGAEAQRTKRVHTETEKLLDRLNEAMKVASSDIWEDIQKTALIAEQSQSAADQGALVLSDASRMEGVGSRTWRALWAAALDYAETEHGQAFPQDAADSHCVLCQQPLDSEARERLSTFSKFVGGQLAADAKKAKTSLTKLLSNLPACPDAEEIAIVGSGERTAHVGVESDFGLRGAYPEQATRGGGSGTGRRQ